MNQQKIAVIGGDERALEAASALLRAGKRVALYGFEEAPAKRCGGYGLDACEEPYTVKEAITGADIVLLPVPVYRRGVFTAPFRAGGFDGEERAVAGAGVTLLGGGIPAALAMGNVTLDLLSDPGFAEQNALPSAEGAIGLALLNYRSVLENSGCAVLGYGRIGRMTAKKLAALGAAVTVYDRKEEKRRAARTAGHAAEDFPALAENIGRYDLIFNTVPFPVADAQTVRAASPHTLYLELASSPGGLAAPAREEAPFTVLDAPGLPGKYSPRYAGEYLARRILDALDKK